MDSSFYLLGGSLWINLVNTRHMHHKMVQDLLMDRTKALLWLEANGLLRASEPQPDEDVLGRVCAELASLRELCIAILSSMEHSGMLSRDIVMSLQEQAERLSITAVIQAESGKLSLAYEGKSCIEYVVNRVIRSIIDTLHAYSPERIRQCEHEECILHFIDTSKSGKRRWCSMESCGNRHKAAEFYAKKRKQSMPADPTNQS